MRPNSGPAVLLIVCLLPAVGLAFAAIASMPPLGEPIFSFRAAIQPAGFFLRDFIIYQSVVPRILLAWSAGAGLTIAASLLQHALQNPLASPTTLGINAGAGLSIGLVMLTMPGLVAVDRPLVAMAGAALAITIVLALGRHQNLAPETLAISGLLVTLGFGAAATSLALLQGQALGALAIWGGGTLDQRGWLALQQMLLHALPGVLFAIPMLRTLETMRLDDAGIRNLGVSPAVLRMVTVLLATWISASIVGVVGNIGFVDLAAAASVRLVGARRLWGQLLWGTLIGGTMLWLADSVAQLLSRLGQMAIPAGAVTALAGAPVLILLAARQRAVSPPEAPLNRPTLRQDVPAKAVAILLALLCLIAVSLCFGHGLHGWQWSSGSELRTLLPWRAPRVVGAASAGTCLALAGVLVQALMANQMASPELLGVGPAACLANVILLLLVPDAERHTQLMVGAAGAAATLIFLLVLVRKSSFSPSRIVLLGIGLAGLLGAGVNLAVALKPLDFAVVLSWVAGSTYHTTWRDAEVTFALASAALAVSPLVTHWLRILPLGAATSIAIGVPLSLARLSLLSLAALLSAAGTLMVGPFAFIGLMAPHLARLLGARKPYASLILASLTGATLMVAADFIGRNLLFPYQLPAGAMASFLGTFAAIWLLFRR
jgi:ferric hydroxamate transport system permease protein